MYFLKTTLHDIYTTTAQKGHVTGPQRVRCFMFPCSPTLYICLCGKVASAIASNSLEAQLIFRSRRWGQPVSQTSFTCRFHRTKDRSLSTLVSYIWPSQSVSQWCFGDLNDVNLDESDVNCLMMSSTGNCQNAIYILLTALPNLLN